MLLKKTVLPEPYIAYNSEHLHNDYLSVKNLLPSGSALLYSLKANNNYDLIMSLSKVCDGFDIASPAELNIIAIADVRGKIIMLTGHDKYNMNIVLLKRLSIFNQVIYSVESENDFELFLAYNQEVSSIQAIVRISFLPPAEYGIYNGLPASHFGITPENLCAFFNSGRISPSAISGFHFYIGSQIKEISMFPDVIAHCLDLTDQIEENTNIAIKNINFGGGFPAPFASRDNSHLTGINTSLALKIATILKSRLSSKTQVIFESGRAIISRCGTLHCSISDINLTASHPYVIINTGISQVSGLYLTRRIKPAAMEFFIRNENLGVQSQSCNYQTLRVYGNSCTALDFLGLLYYVNSAKPEIGTSIVCYHVGAYCASAGLNGFHAKSKINEVVT